MAFELGARGLGVTQHALAQRQIVARGRAHVVRNTVVQRAREGHGGMRVVLGLEGQQPEPELDRRGQIAGREERQELLVSLARLVRAGGVRPGVGHQELRLVGGRITGELAHDPAESVRGLLPVLLAVVAARDLELGIGGEGAGRELLDQARQHLLAVGTLAQAVERELGPALGLAGLGRAREGGDRGREALEGRGIVAGVVLALRHAQRRQCGRRALSEVRQQAAVAAPRIVVTLGLEVGVAHARPGTLGHCGRRTVAHDGLPAVHGVAGAVEAQVAQPTLIERRETPRVGRVAAHEVLVGRRGLAVALLVEALVRDVEQGAAHDRRIGGVGVALKQPLLAGHREAVAALARVGPAQQLERRGRDRLVRVLAREPLERGLGLGVARLGRGGVGVDQHRPCPPRRAAGGQLLEQQVGRTRELPQVAGLVPGELEHAQRGLGELAMLGCREGDQPGAVATRGVAIEHQLKVGRGDDRPVLAHQAHARQIGRRRRLGLERIARDHRLVGPGRIGATPHAVEAARDLVLGARCDLVLEVARQYTVELDDGLGVVTLGRQRLAHQELGARRDVAAGALLGDAAQERERGVHGPTQEQRPGGAQLGLGLHGRIGDAGGDTGEILGGAAGIPGGEERVGLGEQRVVAQRGIRPALRRLLEQGGRLETGAQGVLAQRRQVGVRGTRAGPQHGQRLRGALGEVERQRAGHAHPRIVHHPAGVQGQPRQRRPGLANLAAAQRVAGLGQARLGQQWAVRKTLLPAHPGSGGTVVIARRLLGLDRGELRVGGERAAGREVGRAAPRRGGPAVVSGLEAQRTVEGACGRPAVRLEPVLADHRQVCRGLAQRLEARGAREQTAGLEVESGLPQPRCRERRGTRGGRGGPRRDRGQQPQGQQGDRQCRRAMRAHRGLPPRHGTGTTGTAPCGPPDEISMLRIEDSSTRPSRSLTCRR